MKNKLSIILSFIFFQFNIAFSNNENQDFMHSIGKIYVVVAVIVAAFIGLTVFMIYMDRKISRLERLNEQK
jgi:asparagine N-glycosylation enzyme membrane subunit Stt3